MTIRWVFFDMDGTLADSLPRLRVAYRAFLASHGATPSDAEFDRLNGPALQDVVRHLRDTHGLPGTVDSLMSDYREVVRATLAEGVELMAGAAEAVEACRGAGIDMWLVTASEVHLAKGFLDRYRWRGLFAGITHGGEVAQGKPSPAIYHRAVDVSGANPDTVLVVEDSVHGVTSAKAAGLRVVSVGPVRLEGDAHLTSLDTFPEWLKAQR